VNVYFMQPKGDPAIYCVQANLSSRFHIDSLAHMNDIYYVLAQNGGKVLIPPAPGGININGFWVWSAEPAFVAMIPLAA
jgi:hypothetical protein